MRYWAATAGAVVGLALVWWAAPEAQPAVAVHLPATGSADVQLAGGCRSSDCNLETPELTRADFDAHLQSIAGAPLGEAADALDTLLFHGEATMALLEAHGAGPLDPARTAHLVWQLERTHAQVAFRVVGDDGTQRASLPDELVPLGVKQHLHLEHDDDLPPIEAAGTVVRTGVDHLWARF